jgi:hypothetical protein
MVCDKTCPVWFHSSVSLPEDMGLVNENSGKGPKVVVYSSEGLVLGR